MKIEHTLDIAAPPEVVWALTHDIEAWPELTPTITSVERLDTGPLSVGSQARVEQPRLPARTWTVTHLEPGHRLTWWTRLFGVRMIATHQVDRIDPDGVAGGARNTLVVEFVGPLSRLVGATFRRQVQQAIATENEGFRATAEARTGVEHAG